MAFFRGNQGTCEVIGPSNQGRRLALERTYIQGDENRLEGLLQNFRRAGTQQTQAGTPTLATVIDTAKLVNQVRFKHGDDYDRLTTSFQGLRVRQLTDCRNPSWESDQPTCYSPTSVLEIADVARRHRVGATPIQIWLPFSQQSISVDDILRQCASYRGPPCQIMELDEPQGCASLGAYLQRLGEAIQDNTRHLREVEGLQDLAKLQAKMLELQNESACLYCLIGYVNSRLLGAWDHSWQPPTALAKDVKNIMAGVLLSKYQKEEILKVRRRVGGMLLAADVARNCHLDIAGELVARMPQEILYSTQENVNLLDSVEAAEWARFQVAAVHYIGYQAVMNNILSPLQSAHVSGSLALLLIESPESQSAPITPVHFVMFFNACLVTGIGDLASWLCPEEDVRNSFLGDLPCL